MTDPRPAAPAAIASPAEDAGLAVQMLGITKRFPGLVANDKVDFDLRHGEVHALLGENGAGKSTLMNILVGLYQPDEGTIGVEGTPRRFASPQDAIEAGLGMVHQHFTLVPTLTVTENVLLGLREPRLHLDLSRFDDLVDELASGIGLQVDPKARIWQLSVGEQQRVEIIKMVYRGARILILDEPTAVLAPQEADELFRVLRGMTQRGASVILISHKLGEVLAIADRVTVLRHGQVTAAGIPAAGQGTADLARLMVGRTVLESLDKEPQRPGAVVLELSGVGATSDRGFQALHGIDLRVRSGEIVGIAGVAGNGQTELAEVVTGLRRCEGRISVDGRDIANRPAIEAIAARVAHVPEDRQGTGSAPNLSLTDNLIMKSYRDPPISRGWTIDRGAARAKASGLKDEFAIVAPSIDTEARLLSGGNLQRLILARELSSGPGLIVAVQPTRGLDVGAIETVHRMLLQRRKAGTAILLISEELDEIQLLADRIAVLYEGRIAGEMQAEDADLETLGLLMTGGHRSKDAVIPAVRGGP